MSGVTGEIQVRLGGKGEHTVGWVHHWVPGRHRTACVWDAHHLPNQGADPALGTASSCAWGSFESLLPAG